MKNTFLLFLLFALFSGSSFMCTSPKPQEEKDNTMDSSDLLMNWSEQNNRFDLSEFEKIGQSEKLSLMKQVGSMYPQYAENTKWPDAFAEYFHFIDIDSDGDKDLIFDGWSGGEPMMVQISLKIGSEYKTVFTDFTNLTSIEFKNGALNSLSIHDPGCCAAIMEHKIQFRFETIRDSLDFWITEHIQHHTDMPKPKTHFEKPVKFEVQNTPYTLRITPDVDSIGFFYPDESKGNVLDTYSKGACGIAYAEQTDETGRVWWYVIMEPKGGQAGKTKNRDDFEPKLKGWMSSRYLKVLNK